MKTGDVRTFSLHKKRKPLPKGTRLVHDLQDNCHGRHAVLIEHLGKDDLRTLAERCYDRALVAPGMRLPRGTPAPPFEKLPRAIRANWLKLALIFEEEYEKCRDTR